MAQAPDQGARADAARPGKTKQSSNSRNEYAGVSARFRGRLSHGLKIFNQSAPATLHSIPAASRLTRLPQSNFARQVFRLNLTRSTSYRRRNRLLPSAEHDRGYHPADFFGLRFPRGSLHNPHRQCELCRRKHGLL
jgi:hypothetical protein